MMMEKKIKPIKVVLQAELANFTFLLLKTFILLQTFKHCSLVFILYAWRFYVKYYCLKLYVAVVTRSLFYCQN